MKKNERKKSYKMTPDMRRTYQMAFDYAMYMMASSYFQKATCKTKYQEGKMIIRYLQLSKEEQYEMEDFCIQYIEEVLLHHVNPMVWKEDVTVKLIGKEKSDRTLLQFEGDKYSICVKTVYKSDTPIVKSFIRKKKCSKDKCTCK